MKILICQIDFFGVGGIEMYYHRMFSWGEKNGYKNVLIVDKLYKIDKTNIDLLNKSHVDIYYSKFSGNEYIIQDINHKYLKLDLKDEIISVSSSYSGYLRGEFLRDKFQCKYLKNYIYIFHPYDSICIGDKNKFKQDILDKINNNNELIFMDEECYEQCRLYYDYKEKQLNRNIIFLSFDCKCFNKDIVNKRINNKCKNILTVTRFEFPFKGYVIGLIKDFKILSEKYPDLSLSIIGYGNGIDKVKETIKENNLEKKINLIGKTDYKELQKFYKDAYIYIGMGTTLLDAANNCTPGIIIASYQYGTNIIGEWYKHSSIVGGISKNNKCLENNLNNLIEKIISYSSEDYMKLCFETHNEFEKYYSIDINMNKLISIEDKKQYILNDKLIDWQKAYSLFVKKRYIKDKIQKKMPKIIIKLFKDLKGLKLR